MVLVTPLILVIETTLCIYFSVWFFLGAYKQTKHASYLLITIGYLLVFLAESFAASAYWILPEYDKYQIVFVLYGLTNTFLSLGFICIINGFIRIRFGYLGLFTHIPTVLLGALIPLLWNSENKLYYSYKYQVWIEDYSIEAAILTSLLCLSFLIEFFVYFVLKIKNRSNKLSFWISCTGIIIVIVWGITVSVNKLYLIRAFSLNIGLLFVSLAVKVDPLCYIVTKKKVSRVIFLYSITDQPLFQYNLITKKIEHNLEKLDHLSAIQTMLADYIEDYEQEVKMVALSSAEMVKVSYKEISLIAIGEKLDINITTALYYLLVKVYSSVDLSRLAHDILLTEKEERRIIANLDNVMESIVVT